MRIQHLRECIRLAQTLSFTQTAREFFITQPVLSKHVSSLEKELGTKLFVRNQHGVLLTNEGESFLGDAAGIVQRYDNAVSKVRAISDGGRRSITLGYLAGASRPILPDVIGRFSEKRPDVELNLVSLELDEILVALDSKRIDIGITTSYNSDFIFSERYGWQQLYPDRLVLFTRVDHRFAKKSSVSIPELAGERFVCQAPQFMKKDTEKMIEVLAPVIDQIELYPIMHDLESAQLFVGTGDYVQLGFEHFKNKFGDQFAYIPISDAPGSQFYIGAVWRKEDESQAIRDLAEIMKNAAARRFETP